MTNFKIYDVTTWETNTCNVHIAQYLKKYSKRNQTMKFSQLKEYNTRNIFLKNLFTDCWEETVLRPVSKIKIEHISGSKVETFIQFVFIVCELEGY